MCGTPAYTLTIQDFLKEIKTITNWYVLGVALNIPQKDLNFIQEIYHNDVTSAKISLYLKWLAHDGGTSWSKLFLALKKIGSSKKSGISKLLYVYENKL